MVPIGPGRIHRRAIGDVLHPEREPRQVLDQLKIEMGSYDFTAQYQQAPVPAGGNMINWEWFGFFSDPPPLRDGAIIVQSWDTASTKSELASYSVGITAQVDKIRHHLGARSRARPLGVHGLEARDHQSCQASPAESHPRRGPSLRHRPAADLEA